MKRRTFVAGLVAGVLAPGAVRVAARDVDAIAVEHQYKWEDGDSSAGILLLATACVRRSDAEQLFEGFAAPIHEETSVEFKPGLRLPAGAPRSMKLEQYGSNDAYSEYFGSSLVVARIDDIVLTGYALGSGELGEATADLVQLVVDAIAETDGDISSKRELDRLFPTKRSELGAHYQLTDE